MSLSEQATTELKEILRNDIGQKVEDLTKNELQQLGIFVLTVSANALKVRARLQK